MQHVLRCWERQSDGSEYKETLRWPGLRPGPCCAEGAYSDPANPLVGGEGLALPSPRTPSLALGSSGLASSTPHSKISFDAVATDVTNTGDWKVGAGATDKPACRIAWRRDWRAASRSREPGSRTPWNRVSSLTDRWPDPWPTTTAGLRRTSTTHKHIKVTRNRRENARR